MVRLTARRSTTFGRNALDGIPRNLYFKKSSTSPQLTLYITGWAKRKTRGETKVGKRGEKGGRVTPWQPPYVGGCTSTSIKEHQQPPSKAWNVAHAHPGIEARGGTTSPANRPPGSSVSLANSSRTDVFLLVPWRTSSKYINRQEQQLNS